MTMTKLMKLAGAAALLAGTLFVLIQPLHPADILTSVAGGRWAAVHYATLLMTILFSIGVAGIYARQVEESGWVGFIGAVSLNLALFVTGAVVFIEAFISPVLAGRDPQFVEALLGMTSGIAGDVDLGPLPTVWTVSGALFPLGCALLGIATMRAKVLSRWAGAVFAFGLPLAGIVDALLPQDLHRLAAIPIGIGLACLGCSLWTTPVAAVPATAPDSLVAP